MEKNNNPSSFARSQFTTYVFGRTIFTEIAVYFDDTEIALYFDYNAGAGYIKGV